LSSRNGVSKHHIHPRSRSGLNVPENEVYQSAKKHAAFHILFYNMIPEEIGEYLAKDWWKDKYNIVVERKCSTLCLNQEEWGEPCVRRRELPSAKEQFTYYLLFKGMTPEIVLFYLAEEWWGNQFNVSIIRKEGNKISLKEGLFNRVLQPTV